MRPATSERIRQAIDELGYAPNQAARQLKTGHVAMLGLIVASVANPFWGAFAHSVEEAALAHGYQVLLCNGERDPEREQRYAETLWASGIRGLIFGSSSLSVDHLLSLAAKGLHIVAFDRPVQHNDPLVIDSVGVDNVLGAKLALRHLVALGHRRSGFISGPLRTVSRLARLEGYRTALAEANLELDPSLIWEGSLGNSFGDFEGAELGRAAARQLLQSPNPPTALFAINDMYALGAYAGIRDLGLRVPEDVSVVGFDNIVLAEIAQPPLTTVCQPIQTMMRTAVEILFRRLQDKDTSLPEHITITPELIVRASTAAWRP
jgi:DNA-binding LacI/PurR family transcriptional regulator